MKAVKGNKVYSVETEKEKKYYKDRGFDIQDDNGEVIEYGKGKTVPYEQYKKLMDELERLKASGKDGQGSGGSSGRDHSADPKGAIKDELGGMSMDELKVYAEVNGINIGNATSKDGILKKIREAGKEQG